MQRWIPILLALGACEGAIASPAGSGGEGAPSIPDPVPAERCAEAPLAARAPLRRLSSREYAQTVARLFEGVALPELALPEASSRFDNDAAEQGVSSQFVSRVAANASAIAEAALQDTAWLGCDIATEGCVETLLDGWVPRVLRRRLRVEERSRFEAHFAEAESLGGPHEALQVFVSALMQSESFLYRPEFGDPALEAPNGAVALSGEELATRLSFFLTGAAPSARLLARADELVDERVLEEETRALLESPEGRRTIADVHRMWMHFDRLEELEMDGELRDDLRASTLHLLGDAFEDADASASFLQLAFAEPTGYVNDRLASYFGVDAPGSSELVPLSLPEAERAGALTQPGMLAAASAGLNNAPIHRGLFILSALLCTEIDEPSADLEIDPGLGAEATGLDPNGVYTAREEIEAGTSRPDCVGCHAQINPLGFALEHYDEDGRYRTADNTLPIDASGAFEGVPFNDARELSEQLAASPRAAACVAENWHRFAFGSANEDPCQLQNSRLDMIEAGDPKEMIVRLVLSPTFRLMPSTEGVSR